MYVAFSDGGMNSPHPEARRNLGFNVCRFQRQIMGSVSSLSALLEELRHKTGPAGLMTGSDTRAIVAMKVLVEEQMVTEVRIVLHLRVGAEDRSLPVDVAQENM